MYLLLAAVALDHAARETVATKRLKDAGFKVLLKDFGYGPTLSLDGSGPDCKVPKGTFAWVRRSHPELDRLNVSNAALPPGTLEELAGHPGLTKLFIDTPIDRKQVDLFVDPKSFPNLRMLHANASELGKEDYERFLKARRELSRKPPLKDR